MRGIGIAVWVSLVITLFGLPAGVQAQGDGDGLVAEWHFDEGSGSVLGKIKVSSGHYFTTPVGAVMECLKPRGEEPDRCSPVRIAGVTGVPLAAVLEVIGGLLGSECV
ncbi:MAG: hypothetical protein KAU52_02825 [Methanosarcinales archaeon]|nr:hypothetical protein [Methanosarcinales archaeon]